MKKVLSMLMVVIMIASMAACGAGTSAPSSAPSGAAEITFMFWGGAQEKAAIEQTIEKFNTAYQGKIHVTGQYVPDEYAQKLSSQIAAGKAPDIAYVSAGSAVDYALDGTLLSIEDLLGEDKTLLDDVIPSAQWKVNGKTAFFSTALESLMITYNRDIFDELGVEYPPTDFDKALTWDEFVNLAKQLTVDQNGNNALSPNFDSEKIRIYGFTIPFQINNWYPLLRSMGGDILTADSSNTNFDSPEMIDLMTKIQNLIVTDHVSPSMTDISSNPDPTTMMVTGQVAMIVDGNWSFLDYDAIDLNVGCTMFPDMGNGSFTLNAPGVTAIFSSTKYPQEALEFYKYSLDTEKGATELYQNGLWQPIFKEYYTDPAKIAFWAETGSRPKEYVDVVVKNIEKNVCLMPVQFIKSYSEIGNVLNPAIDAIFRGEGDPATLLKDAQATINSAGFYKGRFDQ